jgi:hypothetical protein
MLFIPQERPLNQSRPELENGLKISSSAILLTQPPCRFIDPEATNQQRLIGAVGGAIGGTIPAAALGIVRTEKQRNWADDKQAALGCLELSTRIGPPIIGAALGAANPYLGIRSGILGLGAWLSYAAIKANEATNPIRQNFKK